MILSRVVASPWPRKTAPRPTTLDETPLARHRTSIERPDVRSCYTGNAVTSPPERPMPPQTPAAPPAPPTPSSIDPVLAPGQTVVGVPGSATPADIFQAFRAQRRELGRQLESLEEKRGEIRRELQQELSGAPVGSASKAGREARIAQVDQRHQLRRQLIDRWIVRANGGPVLSKPFA